MLSLILTSLRALVVLTLITGILYPLAMTGLAQALFPKASNGSLVLKEGRVVGSELIAQKAVDPGHFWPRPSAVDYGTVASGASNQGYTSQKLIDAVGARRTALGEDSPSDLLLASGSGLDPHISPAAAEYQIKRVAEARALAPERVRALIQQLTEPPQLGFLGDARVNVFLLNLALDEVK